MKVLNHVVAALAASVLLVSCASQSGSLSGKWIVNDVDGKDVSECETTPYLSLDEQEGRVNGCLGINLLIGSYSYKNGSLTFSNMGSTMMAGSPEDADIERALSDALEHTAKASIDGDKLSLCDKSGKILVTLTKAPAEEHDCSAEEGEHNCSAEEGEHNCSDCEHSEE